MRAETLGVTELIHGIAGRIVAYKHGRVHGCEVPLVDGHDDRLSGINVYLEKHRTDPDFKRGLPQPDPLHNIVFHRRAYNVVPDSLRLGIGRPRAGGLGGRSFVASVSVGPRPSLRRADFI